LSRIRLQLNLSMIFSIIFFFQAEDGIRDRNVTGVQTCALPILSLNPSRIFIVSSFVGSPTCTGLNLLSSALSFSIYFLYSFKVRSEERRVGKECRSWWWTCHYKKKDKRMSIVVYYMNSEV